MMPPSVRMLSPSQSSQQKMYSASNVAAAYAQVDYALTGRVHLGAGVRAVTGI